MTTKDATDPAIGSSLRLTVKEKVAPVITVTNPTASATLTNNKPTITWSVTDDDSGVNPSTIGITIDSGSKITDGITKTAVTVATIVRTHRQQRLPTVLIPLGLTHPTTMEMLLLRNL